MIRLQRTGRTNDPSFRVVLTDRRNSPKSQNFVEILGNYEVKKGVLVVDKEKVLHFIKMGAQVSPTMHNLLISQKIISGKKINVLPRKSPIKKAESEVLIETTAPAQESVPEVAIEAPLEPEIVAETPAN
ncbi:MAG: 30S ribosomal protein S16 [Candidatus Lloydbacteria bacterium RIFCSPHIGHO2_01_FULL_41_20]|uniref:30S ribosomal protein S16 n=1 Tax=Candidatus Lloydbacteria bacterium RIFCSPHIGHO2_01_FULL_41_20 TaxID=1798657 RepID=A0A1G2CQL9_9BACT|nr:MAG: 30S ribosomal protein S16 [Candidatus Lloydbacteria bacterium RIFCSPHIGHO2_01_FULL_41_20]